MFTRSEVIVLTNKQTNTPTNTPINKQTPLKTSNALRYATTWGNNMHVVALKFLAKFVECRLVRAYICMAIPHETVLPNFASCISLNLGIFSIFMLHCLAFSTRQTDGRRAMLKADVDIIIYIGLICHWRNLRRTSLRFF